MRGDPVPLDPCTHLSDCLTQVNGLRWHFAGVPTQLSYYGNGELSWFGAHGVGHWFPVNMWIREASLIVLFSSDGMRGGGGGSRECLR